MQETPWPGWPKPEVFTSPPISIIVPTYNEVENIADLIAQIDEVLQRHSIPGEILIVDDHSPDGTAETAQAVKTLSELRVIVRREERDLSRAVLEGFRQARHGVLVVCDSDFSHPVQKIPALITPILENRADMVIGSRYAAGGRVEGWSWYRKLFSRVARLFARPLVKTKDPLSGFFAVRKCLVENTPLRPEGYKIGLELMVRLTLDRVVEVPIVFRDRQFGASKLGSRTALLYARHLWRLMAFQLESPGNRVSKWILAAILGISGMLHLVTAASVGVIPEEAYHWNYAQHPDLSYLDHPPIVGWMIWLGTHLFGDNRVGVRFPAVLASTVTALLISRITHSLSASPRKERDGLLAVLLYAAIPYYWGLGFVSMPDTFLLLFWTATLYGLSQAVIHRRTSWWYGAGIFLGLGMLSKYTAVLLAGSVFLLLWSSGRERSWLLRKEPYHAGLLALVLFSPVLIWNLQHDWVSFRFQTIARFEHFKPPSAERFVSFLATQSLVVWPPVFLLMVYTAAKRIRSLVVGEDRGASLLLWSFVPTFLAFAFVGLRAEVHIAWPAPAYVGLIPLIAMSIGASEGKRKSLWRRVGCALLFLPLAVYVLAALYLPIFGVPPTGRLAVLSVWEGLASRVAKEEATMIPGSYFIFADGKYQMASELAFHLRAPERVYSQNVLGQNAVSFVYWGDLASLKGKDAIFVADSIAEYTSGTLQAHFTRVSPPERIEVRKAQALLGTFFLVRCYGYRGPTP